MRFNAGRVCARAGRAVLAALAGALLTACATAPPSEPAWPAGLPPKSYFAQIYAADPVNQAVQSEEEYLQWVVRFYSGWRVYGRGWDDISAEVLEQVPADRYPIVGAKLVYLGQMIAGEWAKDSEERAIFNNTVSVWGEAIVEAAERSEVEAFIDQVIRDVEALLVGELLPETIVVSRYYDLETDLPFDLE